MTDLKTLKKEFKKIVESDSGVIGDGKVDDAAGVTTGGGPEDNKGFKAGKPVGFQSVDKNSKPVQAVARDEGVKASGIKEFKPENAEMKGVKTSVKPVGRAEGAAAGVSETGKGDANIGKKGEVEKANRVDREEGAGAGAGEVGEYGNLSGFRNKVRAAFGLSLDDKLNKGNDGLNKKS
jgi:hypothetical protein